MRIKILLIIFLHILISRLAAQQKINLKGAYLGFLDNREYFNPYTGGQTMFGNRLNLGAEYSIDSVQKLYTGVDYIYEFGAPANHIPLLPSIYYAYTDPSINFKFGSFPREGSIDYPYLLLTDTLQYYRPNIEGSYFRIKSKHAFQNIWIDWVGRQSKEVNESFLAGTSGHFRWNHFFVEDYLYMYHHAAKLISTPDFHLRDNGGGIGLAGLQLGNALQTKFSIGIAFSYDRFRPANYQIHKGLYAKAHFSYKYLGINLIHYHGESISLAYGDAFYRAPVYTRIDGEINFLYRSSVRIYMQWSAHFFDHDINTSQKLMISFKIPSS